MKMLFEIGHRKYMQLADACAGMARLRAPHTDFNSVSRRHDR